MKPHLLTTLQSPHELTSTTHAPPQIVGKHLRFTCRVHRYFIVLLAVVCAGLFATGRAQTDVGLGVERLDSFGTYHVIGWRITTTTGYLYSDGSFVPGPGAGTLDIGGTDPTAGGFFQLGSFYTAFAWEARSLYEQAFPWATFTPAPSNGPNKFGQWRVDFQNGGGGGGEGTGLGWGISRNGLPFKLVGAGHLNDDGSDDLVFQTSTGQIYAWLLHGLGTNPTVSTIYAGALAGWRVAAVGDLNQDGISDLILQYTTGAVFGWLLDSTGGLMRVVTIYSGSLAGWRVAAAGDLDADGIPDLIFQHTNGAVFAWLMDGTGTPRSSIAIYSGALAGWKVVAMGDLNRDGVPDIVLQNTVGVVAAWLMDGRGAPKGLVTIYSSALIGWTVAAMADINRDGIPDLILQNQIGQLYLWIMDGAGAIQSAGLLNTRCYLKNKTNTTIQCTRIFL